MSSLSKWPSRIVFFTRRNGFRAAVMRVGLTLHRMRMGKKMAIFSCDTSKGISRSSLEMAGMRVEQKASGGYLEDQDRLEILNSGNPSVIDQSLELRFARGASLWLLKIDDRLAAFGWTIRGQTVEPHFFQLAAEDVHFFDFFVFPDHRGKGVNPALVCSVLHRLSLSAKASRAYIECAAWNESQLKSLARTPFQRVGTASKYNLFGRTLVLWSNAKSG